jgi:hypothetical protein
MTQPIKVPKYTSREEVAEIFADGIKNIHFTNGVLHAELTVTRMQEPAAASLPPNPPAIESTTAGRLVLTPNVVIAMASAFQALMTVMQKQAGVQEGTGPPPPAQGTPPPPAKH